MQDYEQYLKDVNKKLDKIHAWLIEVCEKHEI